MKQDILSDSIRYVQNPNGPELGYSILSGVEIIQQDGLYFKNMSRSGTLQPFEDWRLPAAARAKDLARRLTTKQIAGLMLNGGFMEFPSSDENAPAPWEVTERYQYAFRDLGVRHVILGAAQNVEDLVRLNNNRQAFIEALDLPIPLNMCSDPRHGADNSSEFNQGAGTTVSRWTETLGLAATFDPALIRKHGEIAAKEYRAIGITTALSPQVDLATEPRWNRVKGTFGEGAKLATDMARAYIDGFQTSEGDQEIEDGWGRDSVATICKHWPGGGTGEAGRDAHNANGKYAVYPGNNLQEQLAPFVNGALKLDGKTGCTAGMMPYYTIPFGVDPSGKNIANAYSPYVIQTLLREKYGYQGIVCSDWEIVKLPPEREHLNFGIFKTKRCWGMEEATPQEQSCQLLLNTIDQRGGDNDVETLLEGYELACTRVGTERMRAMIEASAVRILTSMFRMGLFENPYLKLEESLKIVGCPEYRAAGFDAQIRSIVMLKNRGNVLPLSRKAKLYVPRRSIAETTNWRGEVIPAHEEDAVSPTAFRDYTLTEDPSEADAAIVFVDSPKTQMTWDMISEPSPEQKFTPITLQYRPYTAVNARAESLAGDDPNGMGPNRSYRGKTAVAANEGDLDLILDTRKAMGDKPVIVVMNCENPCVVSEFEPAADAILVHFNVFPNAVLEIIFGNREPSALLPLQFPANMDTVEMQSEDVPFDMECHRDTEGHVYDYAYGLNWSGVILDERTKKYGRP